MNRITKHILCLVALLCALNVTTIAHAYDPTLVYPVNVQQHTPRVHVNGSPYWGPNQWGFDMYTDLLVYDNKGNHWGKGDIHETFDKPVTKPAYPGGGPVLAANLNAYGANGWWYNGFGLVAGVFTDNQFSRHAPLTSPTANTGNDQWFTVNQTWQAYYGTGTTYWNKYKYKWDLNTMALDYRQTYYTRSPGY